MILGSWTLDGTRGFTPAELAAAIGQVSEGVELFYIDAISHAQPAGWDRVVHSPEWTRLTLKTSKGPRMQLHVDRRTRAEGAFKGFAEVEGDAGAEALAKQLLEAACPALGVTVGDYEPAQPADTK